MESGFQFDVIVSR